MNNNLGEKVIASLVVLGIILVIGLFASADAPKCIEYGCDREQASGSNSGSRWESYDAGYEDVYDNEDYDYDRYESDPEYANGVDDAMEDVYEEYGEEW